jgi:Alpha-glutamyl/putrescinyl thymine pyrophosphorylase clade 2
MLMQAGDRPAKADDMLNWFLDHRETLAWDTDRRYHRKAFPSATLAYLSTTRGSAVRYWRAAEYKGWEGLWHAARILPTMGRLSAWSYLEYLKILGVTTTDADNLMLHDLGGSRSHRNGLALLMGHPELMWWRFNPGSSEKLYTPTVLAEMELFGQSLLHDAEIRNPGHPHVGYLTLESALCTFKSWHVPNRRYTGVYNDMLYDRLKSAESRHGKRFDVIWESRYDLPYRLRMEHNLNDPGCVPVKQNHFLETGEPVMLGYWYDDIGPSTYDLKAASGAYRQDRKWQ